MHGIPGRVCLGGEGTCLRAKQESLTSGSLLCTTRAIPSGGQNPPASSAFTTAGVQLFGTVVRGPCPLCSRGHLQLLGAAPCLHSRTPQSSNKGPSRLSPALNLADLPSCLQRRKVLWLLGPCDQTDNPSVLRFPLGE